MPVAVRTALQSLIGHIRNTVETVEVRNTNTVPLPRGTIVSYVQLINASVDYPGQVRPSSDDVVLPPLLEEQCKGQFCGILETALPAPANGVPGVAVARHNGGPVYCRMDEGLTPHVGDAVWAHPSDARSGVGVNGAPPSALPIYVGMIDSLGDYDPLADWGTTGVYVIVKHEAPPES
jgi:hypothetical protein